MVSWSTDTINERERFSYWREMICNTLFSISPEAPPERFSARITVRNSGALRFATCESTSYEIIRTRRDIARAPADHYTIYLQLRGLTAMEQSGEAVSFGRNDIVISDCRRPFRAMLSNDGCRAVAVVPRAMVNSRAPWLRQRPVYKFSNSRFLDLARRHMIRLVSDDLNETESYLLTENKICIFRAFRRNLSPSVLASRCAHCICGSKKLGKHSVVGCSKPGWMRAARR